MKTKQLMFNEEARQKILKGVETLAQAVMTTLGPKGRNVTIEKVRGTPMVTKDGVTVAKEFVLKDRFENIGAQLVREVSEKTAEEAGDGTTTAVVLAKSIYKEGMRSVMSGCNPMSLKRGMDKAVKLIVQNIEEMSKPISDHQEILNVATLSANSDEEIGGLIADAVAKVGKDGAVTVENSKSIETTLDLVDGTQFRSGWESPYLITNQLKMEAELEDSLIFLYDSRLNNLKELFPLLEGLAGQNRPVLIVSEHAEPEVLHTLVVNHLKGVLKCCAVKMYGYGEHGKSNLEDLAILAGATVVSRSTGMLLKDVTNDMLGSAAKVRVSKTECTIMSGAGDEKKIEDRIAQIKEQLEKEDEGVDKLFLKARLARMVGGIAVINVGASSEVEAEEKKMRIDDAICATKAAIEEGIVPGGGCALLRASQILVEMFPPGQAENMPINTDETIGARIILKACESPIRQICKNAGEEGTVVIKEVLTGDRNLPTVRKDEQGQKIFTYPNIGFNAASGKYVDMFKEGIIDPTKVVRLTLQNAASIAGLLLTTECVICDEDDVEMQCGGKKQ